MSVGSTLQWLASTVIPSPEEEPEPTELDELLLEDDELLLEPLDPNPVLDPPMARKLRIAGARQDSHGVNSGDIRLGFQD